MTVYVVGFPQPLPALRMLRNRQNYYIGWIPVFKYPDPASPPTESAGVTDARKRRQAGSLLHPSQPHSIQVGSVHPPAQTVVVNNHNRRLKPSRRYRPLRRRIPIYGRPFYYYSPTFGFSIIPYYDSYDFHAGFATGFDYDVDYSVDYADYDVVYADSDVDYDSDGYDYDSDGYDYDSDGYGYDDSASDYDD